MDNFGELLEILETLRSKLAEKPQDLDLLDQYFDTIVPKFGEALKNANAGEGSGLNPAFQLLSSFLAELNLYQVSDEPDLRNDSIDRLGLLLEQAQILSLLPSVEAPRSPTSHRRQKSEGKRSRRQSSQAPVQSKELKTSGGEQAAAAELRREKRESKEASKEREPKTEKKMKRSSTHPKPTRGDKDEGQKVTRQSSSKNLGKSRVASTSDPDANGADSPKDATVKENSTKDTLAKTKDTDRKETERKDSERRENDRKEAERKEAERRELERRDSERKDTERRDLERREAERRDLERREAERRELERREAERRDLERRDSERKDTERRDRDTPPSTPIKESQKERYGTLKKVHSRSRGKLRMIQQPNAKGQFGLEVEVGDEDATYGTLTNVEASLAQDPERAAIMSSTDGAHRQPSPQRISSDAHSAPHSPHRSSLVPRSLAHVALQESTTADVAESTTQSISTSRGVFLPSTTSSDDFQPRLRSQGSVRALAAKFESSGGTPSAIPRRLSASPGSFTDRSQPSLLPKSATLLKHDHNTPPRPASFNGTTKHTLTANAFRAGTLGGKSFAAPQNVVSLQFTVVLAKELATIHTQTSDPYVKVFFYQNHTSEPQLILKTPKLKNTCNPNWGESFEDKSLISHTVSFKNPSNYVLFTIWDWEKVLVHKSLGECKLHYDDVVQLLEKHTAAEGNNPNKVASLTIRLPLTLGKKTNYKACLELNLTISRGYLSTVALSINNPTKRIDPASLKKNDSTPAPKKEKPEKVDTGPKDYSKLFEAGKKDLVEDMMKLVQRYSPNVQEEVLPMLRGDFTDLLNTFHEKLQNDGKLGKLPNDRIADLPLHAIIHQIDFANSNLEFEFLSNFVQFFNSTIGFYETISDSEIFVKPVNMHEVKSSSNKVLTGLVTLLLKIKGAVVPELMVTHTKISTTLKNHLTKMMINPHIEKFDLSKYVGTQQMRYIAYKFKLTLLLKLNRLAGVVTNILTSNLVHHKECVVSTITLCDTFLSEVLLCLTIAETLHWVYTTELEAKCTKSSTTASLKLGLESALATYTGQLVDSSTAIQPFKEVEHFFIAMLLSQAHSDSKNAMHCLLEAHANNNAKVVWLLIEQAWNMALTFEREFRISKYIVYSRLGLLLQLFLVKFRDFMSRTLLVKIEMFAKTNFDLLGSQSAAVMEELSKPLLTVPEQFTQRIDVESIKVWYIEPVRYSNMIIHYNSYEVAQQLTIVDFELYHSITHRELSHLKWDKPHETIICNNVIVNIRRINQVAQWVATNVISSETKSERADMLRHFVNIASHLLKIKNFASFIGVMSGLNIASLTRLKETMALFEKTYPEAQQEFEALMYLEDPTGSFAKLRDRVTNSGTQIIPYIGTCLADLTLSDEGNPDTVSVDNVECVNYPKYQLLSNTIKKFLYFQNVSEVSYRFQVEEPLYSKMMSLPSLDDARLYELSLVREPRVQSS